MFICQQDDTPSIIKVHLLLSTKSQKNMIGRVAVISKRSKKKKKGKANRLVDKSNSYSEVGSKLPRILVAKRET